MADEFKVSVTGVADAAAALRALVPKLRRRILRNALAAGARAFRDEAKRLTPTLKTSTYAGSAAIKRGIRKPGTLRNAITVRTSKRATARGDVGVFVNVRPAKGVNRGGKNPNDPFYWRFVEFGTKKMQPRKFLQGAVNKSTEALRRIQDALGKQIQKMNVKGGTK